MKLKTHIECGLDGNDHVVTEKEDASFEDYKEVAWEIYRGEFPNGIERKRELKRLGLDYRKTMQFVDSIVGVPIDPREETFCPNDNGYIELQVM